MGLILQMEPRSAALSFLLATPKFRLEFHRAAKTLSEGSTDVEVDNCGGCLVVKGVRTMNMKFQAKQEDGLK